MDIKPLTELGIYGFLCTCSFTYYINILLAWALIMKLDPPSLPLCVIEE
jgi:hypothetical protein